MHTGKIVTTFKERFNDLCEKTPHNDSEIARELHVSKQTLSAWKCGTRSPKGPTIETIARYFGVAVDWLLGFDVPEHNEKPTAKGELAEEVVNLFADLTPEEIRRVADFVSGLKAAHAGEEVHRK